jgi:small GTP-binding protein
VFSSKQKNRKNTNEYLLKICAIGSGNTGKTIFIRAFAENKFDTNYLPTLGVDITTKRITVDDNPVKLILVDTAGQEFFGKLRPSYYRGASAVLIFCNINDRNSIVEIPNWIKEYRHFLKTEIPKGIVVIEGWDYVKTRELKRQSKRKKKTRMKKRVGSYQVIQTRILIWLKRIFRRISKSYSSSSKKIIWKKSRADFDQMPHLTNRQLVRYLADLHQIKLFEIKIDDLPEINACFTYMSRQAINR